MITPKSNFKHKIARVFCYLTEKRLQNPQILLNVILYDIEMGQA